MNKNNQLHDAHVKAFSKKQKEEEYKAMDIKLRAMGVFPEKGKEEGWVQFVEQEVVRQKNPLIKAYRDGYISGVWDHLAAAIGIVEMWPEQIVSSMPDHIYKELSRVIIKKEKSKGKL